MGAEDNAVEGLRTLYVSGMLMVVKYLAVSLVASSLLLFLATKLAAGIPMADKDIICRRSIIDGDGGVKIELNEHDRYL